MKAYLVAIVKWAYNFDHSLFWYLREVYIKKQITKSMEKTVFAVNEFIKAIERKNKEEQK